MVFLSSSDEDTTIVGIRLCFRDEWNGEEVLYYHHWDRLSKIDITVPPLFTAVLAEPVFFDRFGKPCLTGYRCPPASSCRLSEARRDIPAGSKGGGVTTADEGASPSPRSKTTALTATVSAASTSSAHHHPPLHPQPGIKTTHEQEPPSLLQPSASQQLKMRMSTTISTTPLQAFEARLQEKTRSLFGAPKIDEPIVQGYGAELSSPAAPHRHLNAKLQNVAPAVEDSTFSVAARSASLRVEDLGKEEEDGRTRSEILAEGDFRGSLTASERHTLPHPARSPSGFAFREESPCGDDGEALHEPSTNRRNGSSGYQKTVGIGVPVPVPSSVRRRIDERADQQNFSHYQNADNRSSGFQPRGAGSGVRSPGAALGTPLDHLATPLDPDESALPRRVLFQNEGAETELSAEGSTANRLGSCDVPAAAAAVPLLKPSASARAKLALSALLDKLVLATGCSEQLRGTILGESTTSSTMRGEAEAQTSRLKEKQNKGPPSTDLFVPLPVGWSEHYVSCDMVTNGSSASPSHRPSQRSSPLSIRIRVRRLELLERAEECIALPSLPTGLAAVEDRRRLDLELQYFCQTRLRPFCEKRQISCALWFPVLRAESHRESWCRPSLNTGLDDRVVTPPDTIYTPPASKDSALHRVLEASDSKSSTPTLSSSVVMSRTVTSSALAFSTAKIGVADHPRASQNFPSGRLVWSSKTSDGRRSASTRGLSSSSASSAAQFAVERASPSGAEPRQSENKTRLTNCSDKLWLFLVSTGGHGYRMQSLSLDHTVADGKMLQWVVEKEKERGRDVGRTKQVEQRNYVRPEWMCDPSGDFLRRRLGIETVGPTAHRPASSSQTPGKEQAGFLPRYAATTERATQTSVACVCLAAVLSLSGYCSVFAVVLFAYLLCVFRMAPELFWRPTLLLSLRKKRTFAVIGVCLVGLELVWLVWGGAAAPPGPEPDARFFGGASEAEARWKVRDLDPTDRNAYGQEERRIASAARTAGREGKQQETDADPYTYTPAASRTSTTTFSSGWQRRPRAQENKDSAGGAAARGTPLLPRQEEVEVAAGEEELEEVDDADEDDETDEGVDELPESGRGLPEDSIDAVAAEASLSVSDADDVVVQEEMEQEQEREGELPSEAEGEQIVFPQEQEDGELKFRPYAARQRAGSEYVEGNPWVLLGIALAIGYATQQGWLFSDEVDD